MLCLVEIPSDHSLEPFPFLRNRKRLQLSGLVAFSGGEPLHTPDQVRGRLSPENALPVVSVSVRTPLRNQARLRSRRRPEDINVPRPVHLDGSAGPRCRARPERAAHAGAAGRHRHTAAASGLTRNRGAARTHVTAAASPAVLVPAPTRVGSRLGVVGRLPSGILRPGLLETAGIMQSPLRRPIAELQLTPPGTSLDR